MFVRKFLPLGKSLSRSSSRQGRLKTLASADPRPKVERLEDRTLLSAASQALVVQMYQDLLQRPADAGVVAAILGSAEFLQRADALTPSGIAEQGYVETLYALLLQRTPTSAEVQGWGPALSSAGRAGVALAFLRSVEYRSDAVQGYYAGLLHRTFPPSTLEVTSWLDTSTDLAAIRAGFLESAEFTLNG
jgi:hypothetical protein